MKKYSTTFLSIFVLFLVIIVFYYSQISGKAHIPWDSKSQVYPFVFFVRNAYLSGQLPLWNPYIFSGTPAFADPLYMSFYPGSILYLLPKNFSMTLFDMVEIFHVYIGGVSFYLLAKCYIKNNFGAIICGVIFMLGGPMVGRVQHVTQIIAMSLSPVVLLLIKKYIIHRRSIFLVAASFFLGMILMVGYQPAILFSITAILFLFTESLVQDRSRNGWKKAFTLCIIVTILALGISAIQTIPTIELARNSNRPAFSYDQAVAGSLRVQNLLTIFFPNLFRSLDRNYANYWGPSDITEGYAYVGFLPVLLAALGFLSSIRKRNLFIPITCLCGALYAVGRYTPFYKVITFVIFPLRLFHRPSDGLFIMHIFFCFLVIFGFELLENEITSRFSKKIVFFGSLLVYSIAYFAALAILNHNSMDISFSGWFNFSSCIGLLVSPLVLMEKLPKKYIYMIFAVVITIELTLVSKDRLFNTSTAKLFLLDSPNCSDLIQTFGDPQNSLYRYETIGLGGLRNSAIIWKSHSTQGYSPLMVGNYTKLTGLINRGSKRHTSVFIPSYASPWFNILAVNNIIYSNNSDGQELIDDVERHFSFDSSYCLPVVRNDKALPITYLVDQYIVVNSDDEIAQIMANTMPNNLVILNNQDLTTINLPIKATENQDGLIENQESGIIEVVSQTLNKFEVLVTNNKPSILVFSDTYYPGWSVAVDGKKTGLLRTNLTFKGVFLDAGNHDVTFVFAPKSFVGGTVTTLITLLMMMVIIVFKKHSFKLTKK